MNREIKFRGLMTTGEWIYGLPHLDLPNSTLYFDKCSYRICWNPESGGQSNAPVLNGTLGQYTGLKDKNGVEIYEGDLVEFLYKHPESSEKLKPVVCEIFWSKEGAWCLKWFDKNRYENGARLMPEKHTVIGNIHQHQHLLR